MIRIRPTFSYRYLAMILIILESLQKHKNCGKNELYSELPTAAMKFLRFMSAMV